MNDRTVTLEQKGMHWLGRGLWLLALAGLLYLAGLTLWLAVTGLFFPYQLDYGEGPLLHFVGELARGHNIYKSIEGYPYITANYAPLTHVLALALTPILGLTYATGRIWTLVAIVAGGVLLFAWVRRASGRPWPALAAALLFAGSPYVYHWAPVFRMDLPGLALTLAGLYTVQHAFPPLVQGKKDRPRRLWLAVLLFVAALYAKQSFLFAPAAALAYLFLTGRRWQAVKLGLGMGLLGGGLFLLINALTGGGFWEGLVVSNVNPFLWPEFWQQLADFFSTFAIMGLLTAWYLVDKFGLERATPLRNKVSALDLYLLAALASLWLAGKAGAWENYFFETLAAFALCSGLALAKIGRHRYRPSRLLAPLLVLAQVALMWHTPRVANRYLELTRRSNEAMAPILARTPDSIISEDAGLLVTNDKTLDYFHFQYSQLARAGRWDQAWELGQLRQRRFSLVILEEGTRLDIDRYQRFTREFLSELDRNYRHTRTVGKYALYEPDPLQHEKRAEFGQELALVGWSLDLPPGLGPGDAVGLTVVWQAQRALTTDYTAFAHVVDEHGRGWAGDDHAPYDGLYPTSAWGAGEMVRDTFTLTLPAEMPPGLYDLRLGWYHPETQDRLSVVGGDSVHVAVLPVDWSAPPLQAMQSLSVTFGPAIRLQGFALEPASQELGVTLRWETRTFLDSDYSVFVHLVAPAGEQAAIAQGDAPPMNGRWPTSMWLPGVPLNDRHTIPLPPDLPAGRYELWIGLYEPGSGQRLPLGAGRDALRLTEIRLP